MLKELIVVTLSASVLLGCNNASEIKNENENENEANNKNETMASNYIASEALDTEVSTNMSKANTANNTFGLTPDEFSAQMNANLETLNRTDFTFNGFDIEKGDVDDSFVSIVADAIVMQGVIDKNGTLKSIQYTMTQNDEGDKVLLDIRFLAMLTSLVISPDLPKENTASEVDRILEESVERFTETGEGQVTTVVDGIEYSSVASSKTGFNFSFNAI